jgi:hypothetical protein
VKLRQASNAASPRADVDHVRKQVAQLERTMKRCQVTRPVANRADAAQVPPTVVHCRGTNRAWRWRDPFPDGSIHPMGPWPGFGFALGLVGIATAQSGWTLRTPAVSPSARAFHGVA